MIRKTTLLIVVLIKNQLIHKEKCCFKHAVYWKYATKIWEDSLKNSQALPALIPSCLDKKLKKLTSCNTQHIYYHISVLTSVTNKQSSQKSFLLMHSVFRVIAIITLLAKWLVDSQWHSKQKPALLKTLKTFKKRLTKITISQKCTI